MTPAAPTIAITMAGFGSRFREAGYDVPKYRIEAHGAPLFDWSLRGLDRFITAGSPFLFVVRGADSAEPFISDRARRLGIAGFEIITLAQATDGQATSALFAADRAAPATPFAIFNIDTAIRPGLLDPAAAHGDGWIPCFDAPGEGWSFVRADPAGRALEVREKMRISNHATIGFYWFASPEIYRRAYDDYYGITGREERGERYVAPLYNSLIACRQTVNIATLPFEAVTPLGTPRELAAFLARPQPCSGH